MVVKQEGSTSILGSKPLKLVDKFTYLGSYISSIEDNVNICCWNNTGQQQKI